MVYDKDDPTQNKYRIVNFTGGYMRPKEFDTIEQIECNLDLLVKKWNYNWMVKNIKISHRITPMGNYIT